MVAAPGKQWADACGRLFLWLARSDSCYPPCPSLGLPSPGTGELCGGPALPALGLGRGSARQQCRRMRALLPLQQLSGPCVRRTTCGFNAYRITGGFGLSATLVERTPGLRDFVFISPPLVVTNPSPFPFWEMPSAARRSFVLHHRVVFRM